MMLGYLLIGFGHVNWLRCGPATCITSVCSV